jgi:hypothetical protein
MKMLGFQGDYYGAEYKTEEEFHIDWDDEDLAVISRTNFFVISMVKKEITTQESDG